MPKCEKGHEMIMFDDGGNPSWDCPTCQEEKYKTKTIKIKISVKQDINDTEKIECEFEVDDDKWSKMSKLDRHLYCWEYASRLLSWDYEVVSEKESQEE